MGRIATKQRRETYPIIQPAERMPDTPEYRAQARLAEVAGQVAFGLGMQFKRQQEEDRIEADNISAVDAQIALDKYDYDETKRISTIEFGQIEDFDNAYQEYLKGRDAYGKTLLSGKNEDVQQAIKDHALKTELSSQSRYYNELDRYKTRFSQARFFENQQQIAQSTTPDNIEQQKVAMLANIESYKNFFTPAQINSFKAGVDKNISDAVLEFQRQELWDAALVSATDVEGNVDWQKVLSYLNQPKNTKGVSPDEVDSLIENANTQYRIQTAVTDKPEYWRMLREITSNPQETHRQELIGLAEQGKLEETDRKYLEGKLDSKDDPLKTPRAQLYFNSLNKLFDERETDAEQRLKYDIANEKLVQFFETTKTPTAKQAAEFYDDLISEEVSSITDKVFDFYKGYYQYISGYKAYKLWKERGEKGTMPEPETLADFEDTVRLLDEEDAKAYYEKWKNKW